MRKINTRFFFTLLTVFVLCTGATFVVHRLQASNIASALLFQAGQAEKQGKPRDAARYLGRYLEFVPTDLDERIHLGKLLADPALANTAKARNRARFVLEQVLTRDPQRHEVRLLVCRLHLENRDLEATREQLSLVEKAQPGSAEVLELTGELNLRKGQTAKALENFRAAVKLNPDRVEAQVQLANLLRRLDPKNHGPEIQTLLQTCLEKKPRDPAVLILAAEQARDQGNFQEARVHLETGIKDHPRDGSLYESLARLDHAEGKPVEAVASLRKGIKNAGSEQKFNLYWTLANLLLDANNLDETRKVMTEIREILQAPAALEFLEARCRIVQGRWFEAVQMMERVRPSFKEVPELAFQTDLYLGVCYEQLEEPGAQLTAYKRALDHDPTCTMARKGLAAAQWQLGQVSEAITQYQALTEKTVSGKDTGARKVDLARVLLLAQLQRENPDWKVVESAIDQAEQDQPQAPEVLVLRAELAHARKDFPQAESILSRGLESNRKQVELWAARVSLAQRSGKKDQARQLLQDAQQAAGDSLDLRLAALRFWVEQPREEAQASLVKLDQNLESFSAEDKSRLLHSLAVAHQQVQDFKAAGEVLRQMTRLPMHVEDVNVRLMMFELARVQGEEAAMRDLVAEISKIEGAEGASAKYAEAARQLWHGKQGKKEALEQARTLLTAAAARRPDWHAIALARADLEEMQGRTEQAIMNYRRAIELGCRNPRATRQLIMLLTQSQRVDEAEMEMRRLTKQAGISSDLQRLAVAISLNKKDFQRAEFLARQSVAPESKDYRDHLWMGQVLAARGEASVEAEAALRRATSVGDQMPETWLSLVRYLMAAGKEAARAEIDKARLALPAEKAAVTLAQCYEATGQPAKAAEQYQAALAKPGINFLTRRLAAMFFLRTGQPLLAEPLLRAVVERKVEVSEEDFAWARRALTLTLASTRDPEKVQGALSLAGLRLNSRGELDEDPTTSNEDLLLRAKLLAMQGKPEFRARATAILEDLHGRQALSAEDQFLLAQLLLGPSSEAKGWQTAKDLLKNLAARNPQPEVLSFYLTGLLQQRELLEADRIIEQLEKIERTRQLNRGELGSVEARARVLEMRGQTKEALQVLETFVKADQAPAERLLPLSAMHARLGNLKEAIDHAAQYAHKSDKGYGHAATILRSTKAEPVAEAWSQQWLRVEGLLKEALHQNPKDARLYLQLADLNEMKGNREAMESYCRQVLDYDRTNIVALNNLAWYLAHQEGRAGDALLLINRAVEVHGQRLELLDTRAVIYLVQDQNAKALADLQKIVDQAPTATRYFHLTRAHYQAQDRPAALAALQKANALGLSPARLHPAERQAYERLVAELK